MNSEKKLFVINEGNIVYYSYCQSAYADFIMQLNDDGIFDEDTCVFVKTDDDFKFIGEINDSNLPTEKVILIDPDLDDIICFKLAKGQSEFLEKLLNLGIFEGQTKWIHIDEDDNSINCVNIGH